MYKAGIAFFLCVLFSGFQNLIAQGNLPGDSILVTLADADNLFFTKNFQLLASQFNISAAEASVIQSKLYPNPTLSVDQGAYNRDNKKWFDFSKTGETAASLQQVIVLAGKRNKQINISRINSQIATYQFYDLIRTLRYELHSSFYGLYFLQQTVAVFEKEIKSLKSLVDVYAAQYNKGNVAFKELARLQALQFSLENERIDLLKESAGKQSDLFLLTGDTLFLPMKPVMDTGFINRISADHISYVQLLDSGLMHRYDLKIANAQVQLSQMNLRFQKALRMPDLTLGANWDRQGSYVYNYNSLSLAADLPFWNRNKGNIKAAQYQIEESKQLQSLAELQVKNEILKAFSQLVESDKLYKTSSLQFNSDYEKLLDGITKGYQNHTISLLEFIDYYETYKNSKIEYNKLQNERLDALENLNFVTGTTILK